MRGGNASFGAAKPRVQPAAVGNPWPRMLLCRSLGAEELGHLRTLKAAAPHSPRCGRGPGTAGTGGRAGAAGQLRAAPGVLQHRQHQQQQQQRVLLRSCKAPQPAQGSDCSTTAPAACQENPSTCLRASSQHAKPQVLTGPWTGFGSEGSFLKNYYFILFGFVGLF